MADMKLQDFLTGLKDLIAQAEGSTGEGAPPEGEMTNEVEPEAEAAVEKPEDETAQEQAGESSAQGPSKMLAQFMSKPKMRM